MKQELTLTCAPKLKEGDVIGITWLGDEPSWYRVTKIDGYVVEMEPVSDPKDNAA